MFLRWCIHWRNFIHSLNSAQKSVRAVHRQCADNIKPPWQGGHEGRREGGHQDNVGLCLPRVSRSMSLVSQQVSSFRISSAHICVTTVQTSHSSRDDELASKCAPWGRVGYCGTWRQQNDNAFLSTLVRPYFFFLLADVKPATPLCNFRNNHITSTNVLPAPCSFQSFRHDFGDMLRCDVRKKYS